MKVLVIGKGNLGMDVKLAFEREGHAVYTISRGEKYDRKKFMHQVAEIKPELVINCAGGYSISETENRYSEAIETLLGLLGDLITYLPKDTRLITFSSDYAYQPELSKYAQLKRWCEDLVWHSKRPFTALVRVTTLYGTHSRGTCLPGKLLANCPKTGTFDLPANEIIPTPTDWVGRMLAYTAENMFNDKQPMIYELYPAGKTTVAAFAAKVLGKEKVTCAGHLDPIRPAAYPDVRQSFDYEDWELLWNQRRSMWVEHADQLSLFKQGRIK